MRLAGTLRGWPIWIAVLPVFLWALVRTLGVESGRLVPLLAFTPYVALASVPVAGIALGLRNWPAALLAATATLFLCGAVLPRTIDRADAGTPASGSIVVLSSNVYFGRADVAELRELVERHDVDVLSIQELTPKFHRQLRDVGVRDLLPHAVASLEVGASGGGIYSRWPIRRLRTGVIFGLRMPRAEVRLGRGKRLRIVNVHPNIPIRGLDERWRAGLESLPSTGDGAPWVLAGDFNATLDHATLRNILDDGYRDAGEVTGSGLHPTWPEQRVLPPLITIDHILADRRIGIAGYGVETLSGTDHRAIYAELTIP